ncbi:hypothetical protein BDV26DRAFT_297789 [Aspergillus bertholletiae]|uniref:Uncharacterized protein n=1 Tax=Aspergillus bertholletiae TaxID=1226010 RepID=A0A5N7AU14_9EURO|nr:hypothetical protein BDV26DRAFT_297789 [Aspergillus bertholletiae]
MHSSHSSDGLRQFSQRTNTHCIASEEAFWDRFTREGSLWIWRQSSKPTFRLLSRHFRAARSKQDTLDLHAAFMCLASDTLSQHAFGERHGFQSLEEAELNATGKTKVNSSFELVQCARHFPWLCKLAHAFLWLSGFVCPGFNEVIKLETATRIQRPCPSSQKLTGKQDVKKMVHNVINDRGAINRTKRYAIYPAILENEKVPEDEKQFTRLADDAIFPMISGTDALANDCTGHL